MENKRINLKLAKEFFETARADLNSAEVLLKANNFNNSIYHSQQAVEKVLILKNKFVESHFVADIAKDLLNEKVYECAKSLEKNWIITRYPFRRKSEIWSPVKAFTKTDAIEALKKQGLSLIQFQKSLRKKVWKYEEFN